MIIILVSKEIYEKIKFKQNTEITKYYTSKNYKCFILCRCPNPFHENLGIETGGKEVTLFILDGKPQKSYDKKLTYPITSWKFPYHIKK